MGSKHYLTQSMTVPQSEPLPGMVANEAGGFSYPGDKWARLRRFLILGSEGGSYYASERKMTRENISALRECVAENPVAVLNGIMDVSANNLAPRNDQAIFALAYLMSEGSAEAKQLAV